MKRALLGVLHVKACGARDSCSTSRDDESLRSCLIGMITHDGHRTKVFTLCSRLKSRVESAGSNAKAMKVTRMLCVYLSPLEQHSSCAEFVALLDVQRPVHDLFVIV